MRRNPALTPAQAQTSRSRGPVSYTHLSVVESFGAKAIDYRNSDFVEAVRSLTAEQPNEHRGRAGVDAAFDAIGGAHFARSFACLGSGGLLRCV